MAAKVERRSEHLFSENHHRVPAVDWRHDHHALVVVEERQHPFSVVVQRDRPHKLEQALIVAPSLVEHRRNYLGFRDCLSRRVPEGRHRLLALAARAEYLGGLEDAGHIFADLRRPLLAHRGLKRAGLNGGLKGHHRLGLFAGAVRCEDQRPILDFGVVVEVNVLVVSRNLEDQRGRRVNRFVDDFPEGHVSHLPIRGPTVTVVLQNRLPRFLHRGQIAPIVDGALVHLVELVVERGFRSGRRHRVDEVFVVRERRGRRVDAVGLTGRRGAVEDNQAAHRHCQRQREQVVILARRRVVLRKLQNLVE